MARECEGWSAVVESNDRTFDERMARAQARKEGLDVSGMDYLGSGEFAPRMVEPIGDYFILWAA